MSWTAPTLRALLAEVAGDAGLAIEPRRDPIVTGALEQVRMRHRLDTPEALLVAAQQVGPLRDEVLSALTIGETYFFREPAQLDLLRAHIAPERLRAAGPDGRVHLWSVGCASGEEPYSLAILFEQEGLADRVALFASDVDELALRRARAATYRPWSFREVPEDVKARYFEPAEAGELRLLSRLRERVVFFPFNLAAPDARRLWLGLWGLDVILMRNVLIHLTEPAQAVAYHRVAHALAPGGWLLVAASDPPPPADAPLELVPSVAGQVYRRRTEGPVGFDAVDLERTDAPIRPPPPPAAPPAPSPERSGADEVYAIARTEGAHVALSRLDAALEAAPLDVGLRYARALLCLELGRLRESAEALREVVYLDRMLPEAHFLTALVKVRSEQPQAALRSLENAEALLEGREDAEPLRLGRPDTVGELRVAVVRARVRLGAPEGLG